MVNLKSIKHIYFLGIGGIGMSALARYFKASGLEVSGYDKTATSLTDELISEKINVLFEDDVKKLPSYLSGYEVNQEALIIYTPAIPKNNNQYNQLLNNGYKIYKRSEILGFITRDSITIAVAGTHGKTTTSTMIAHILISSGIDCTAFLGGISKNYNSNLLLSKSGSGPVVVEADEFDRSFLTLHPNIAVITSLDADHLDIYKDHESMIGSYREFAGQVDKDGTLVYRAGLQLKNIAAHNITYAINEISDFNAVNVRIINTAYHFDIVHGNETYSDFCLTWPGRHNVENATGAIAACFIYGVPVDKIKSALESFAGIKRRFEYQIKTNEITFIDDYAHHPEELKATINSVKELYPGKKILGIFQPHLYSRTRDFAVEFAESLSLLDELILLDIYPARELPIEGVTSEMIATSVNNASKIISSRENLESYIERSDARVILTLGAGDIDQLVKPVKQFLEKKYLKQTI